MQPYYKAKSLNGEWVFGFVVEDERLEKLITNSDPDFEFIFTRVQPHTLCTYTGVVDKNDIMIFGNDIIDIHQTVNGCNLFKVVWNEEELKWGAVYWCKGTHGRPYEYSFAELVDANERLFDKTVEIVGNVFDEE